MKKVTLDGRTILKGRAYSDNKLKKWIEQGECCADCGRSADLLETHFHHAAGRGLGGCKRDDLDKDNCVLCAICHLKRHGQ